MMSSIAAIGTLCAAFAAAVAAWIKKIVKCDQVDFLLTHVKPLQETIEPYDPSTFIFLRGRLY